MAYLSTWPFSVRIYSVFDSPDLYCSPDEFNLSFILTVLPFSAHACIAGHFLVACTRIPTQLIAIHKEMGGAARKYALAEAARMGGGGSHEPSEGDPTSQPTSQPTSRPGSALRRTGNSLYSDGEGEDSDWEERYYASSPEPSMFER